MSTTSDIDEEMIEERVITIPFGKLIYGRRIPKKKRTPKAVRLLRKQIKRYWKVETVVIHREVNQAMWKDGIQHPPRRITVRTVKSEEDLVEVFLP